MLIDPHLKENHFKDVEVGPLGIYSSPGRFFLAASQETLKLPDGYIGMVKDHNALSLSGGSLWPPAYIFPNMYVHACAPKIDPGSVFCGPITFECSAPATLTSRLHYTVGSRVTEVTLMPVRTPLNNGQTSRYNGQNGATTSRFSHDADVTK